MTITTRWLWDYLTLTITLSGVVVLALIGVLALGGNSPRPARSPDFEAPSLPCSVDAEADVASVSLLDHPEDDFTFEIIATPVGSPESGVYGLTYRAQDARHCYVFAVGADGYYTVVRLDGEDVMPLVAWQQFPHIRRGGESNRLLVTCSGPSCIFRINDEYATTVEDETWLSGDVGLWAGGLDEATVVEFLAARLWASDG